MQFVLEGPGGGTWVVTVCNGRLDVCRSEVEVAAAGCTIRATAEDYLRIVNGELSGTDAFLAQRLTIEGDLNRATLLAALGLM